MITARGPSPRAGPPALHLCFLVGGIIGKHPPLLGGQALSAWVPSSCCGPPLRQTGRTPSPSRLQLRDQARCLCGVLVRCLTLNAVCSCVCLAARECSGREALLPPPLGCRGFNAWGQSTVPADMATGVAAGACGIYHTCAITQDRTLGCWGYCRSGECSPPAGFDSGVASVSVGTEWTCVVTTAGRLGCFGNSNYGTLAIPSTHISDVQMMSAGYYHA